MNPLYLALGANLGDPAGTFKRAIELTGSRIGKVLKVSSFYRTAPLNPPELELDSQPDFLNAALECECSLLPEELIMRVLEIERELGRVREGALRWGPRVIDIDILMYGSQIVDLPNLQIPHPEMHKRDFVLRPLSEITQDAVHPVLRKTVGELLANLRDVDKT